MDEAEVLPKAAHATFDNVGLTTPMDPSRVALRVQEGPSKYAPAGPQSLTQAGIQYHGGPVMTSPIHLYLIWYGTQWTATKKSIITDFTNGLGGSTWWTGIETTYTSSGGTPVSSNVTLAGQYTYPSPGTSLSDSGVFTVVKSSIGAAPKLPQDANGIYLVLTSQEVNETSGFCTNYCGWHTSGTYSGTDIKYSFVGDSSRCIDACSAQDGGPNGDPGADGLVSVLAHEVAEAASDPDLNAWWASADGMENADKCAWTFGNLSGSYPNNYNITMGARHFLIQQNWKNAGAGSCAMK